MDSMRFLNNNLSQNVTRYAQKEKESTSEQNQMGLKQKEQKSLLEGVSFPSIEKEREVQINKTLGRTDNNTNCTLSDIFKNMAKKFDIKSSKIQTNKVAEETVGENIEMPTGKANFFNTVSSIDANTTSCQKGSEEWVVKLWGVNMEVLNPEYDEEGRLVAFEQYEGYPIDTLRLFSIEYSNRSTEITSVQPSGNDLNSSITKTKGFDINDNCYYESKSITDANGNTTSSHQIYDDATWEALLQDTSDKNDEQVELSVENDSNILVEDKNNVSTNQVETTVEAKPIISNIKSGEVGSIEWFGKLFSTSNLKPESLASAKYDSQDRLTEFELKYEEGTKYTVKYNENGTTYMDKTVLEQLSGTTSFTAKEFDANENETKYECIETANGKEISKTLEESAYFENGMKASYSCTNWLLEETQNVTKSTYFENGMPKTDIYSNYENGIQISSSSTNYDEEGNKVNTEGMIKIGSEMGTSELPIAIYVYNPNEEAAEVAYSIDADNNVTITANNLEFSAVSSNNNINFLLNPTIDVVLSDIKFVGNNNIIND